MPLYDYECGKCNRIFEEITSIEEKVIGCRYCDGEARRIYSAGSQYTANQDAAWIRDVLEVVDKESDKPHVREFIHNPTRENYHRWMKGEGLRHLERNERMKPGEYDLTKLKKEMCESAMRRDSITLR